MKGNTESNGHRAQNLLCCKSRSGLVLDGECVEEFTLSNQQTTHLAREKPADGAILMRCGRYPAATCAIFSVKHSNLKTRFTTPNSPALPLNRPYLNWIENVGGGTQDVELIEGD